MSERMKNVFGALALATAIILATSGIWNAIKAEDNADTSAGNNVGNGQAYTYEITSVQGNEINGVAIPGEYSDDNAGIFLYADELDFSVKEGDMITVVYGAEEDIFESIEYAVMAEDGSYVPASFYE